MARDRVVVLVDMDCFYVQVEQRANPDLKGKPCAVVQYKKWKGGGIIAVGYEARACGVTRQMRGDDAKAKCPNINLIHVPEVRGKADLTRYREAGAEVIEVLSRFSRCVERASIDEAYLDLTEEVTGRLEELRVRGGGRIHPGDLPHTWVVAWEKARRGHEGSSSGETTSEPSGKPTDSDRQAGLSEWLEEVYGDGEVCGAENQRLAVAAQIVEEMRAAVYKDTGFRCSAGIAHNKMLAKLICGLHKPNKQTVLPHDSVPELFSTMPITKVRGFGGKFGALVTEHFKAEFMGDLVQYTQQQLMSALGEKSGAWLYGVCRGIENEPVSDRQLPKSIGCSKNFAGREALNTKAKVQFWLTELSKEVEERLVKDREANSRVAKNLVVSLHQERIGNASSRTCAIVKYDADKFASDAFILLKKYDTSSATSSFWTPSVVNLSIVATKFVDIDDSTVSMKSFLCKKPATATPSGGASPVSQTTFNNQSQRTPVSAKHKPKKGSISHFFTGVSPRSNTVTNSQLPLMEGVSNRSDTMKSKPSHSVNALSRTVDPILTETPKSSKMPLTLTQSQHLFSQAFANQSLQSQSWTNTSLVETQRGNGQESVADESQTAGRKDVHVADVKSCADELPDSPVLPRCHSPSDTGVVPESQSPTGSDPLFTEEHDEQSGAGRGSEPRAAQRTSPELKRSVTPAGRNSDFDGVDSEDVFVPCTFRSEDEKNSSSSDKPKMSKTTSLEKEDTRIESRLEVVKETDKPGQKMGFFARKMLELKEEKQREAERLKQQQAIELFNPEIPVSIETIQRRYREMAAMGNGNYTTESHSPLSASVGTTGPLPASSRITRPLAANSNTTRSLVADSDYSKCEECGDLVSAWDLPEHLDFHFAQKIQREQREQQRLQQQNQQATVAAARTPGSHVTNSNKRKAESAKSRTNSKRSKTSQQNTGQKTLDGFFRRS